MSNQWIGAYEGSPARLYDEFSLFTLVLCTCIPVLFPFLLEDAEKPSWSKSAQSLTSMVKVGARQDKAKMDFMLVAKAQVAANALSQANKALATKSGKMGSAPRTSGTEARPTDVHPLGELASKEAELIAGIHAHASSATAILFDNFVFKNIAHLADFYDIPAVKVVTRVAVHLALLVLHVINLVYTQKPIELIGGSNAGQGAIAGGSENSNKRPGLAGRMLQGSESLPDTWAPVALFAPTWIEIALFGYFLTIFLDRCHRSVKLWQQRNVAGGGSSGGGDAMWGCTTLLYVAAFVLRLLCYVLPMPSDNMGTFSDAPHFDLYRAYQIVLAINSIFVFLCSMPLLSLSPAFGVLTIVLRLMVRDAMIWGTLFLVLVTGFAGAYLGLERAGLYRQATYPTVIDADAWTPDEEIEYDAHIRTHPVVASLWAAFGLSEQDRFMVYTDPLGICYSLIMGLGMSNLLVAMFADSYVNVQSNAKVEYNFLRFQRITEMHEVLMRTPPPFNVLFVLWDLAVFACRGVCYGLCYGLRRKQSSSLKQQNTRLGSEANAEKLAHRLVDLFTSAEDQAEKSSVEGLISSCREMLQEERSSAASRYQKLVGLNGDLSAMMIEICSALPALVASTQTAERAIAPAVAEVPASAATTNLPHAPPAAEYFLGQGSLGNAVGQLGKEDLPIEAEPPTQAARPSLDEPHHQGVNGTQELLGGSSITVVSPSTGTSGSPKNGSVLRARRSPRSGRRTNFPPTSVVQL